MDVDEVVETLSVVLAGRPVPIARYVGIDADVVLAGEKTGAPAIPAPGLRLLRRGTTSPGIRGDSMVCTAKRGTGTGGPRE